MKENEIHFTGVIAYRDKLRETSKGNVLSFMLKNEINHRGNIIQGGLHCVAWNEVADAMNKYARGDIIEVEGFATATKVYDAQTKLGKPVYTTRCNVYSVRKIGGLTTQVEPGHKMRVNPNGDTVPFDIDED
jgi:single-stranded DNA-binding protein